MARAMDLAKMGGPAPVTGNIAQRRRQRKPALDLEVVVRPARPWRTAPASEDTLIRSRENNPPTMTSANGRCESEPTPVESAAGKQAERGDERGHHDRPQPQQRRRPRRLGDAQSRQSKLVGVRDVDHRRLHRHAEQREKSDTRRNRERRAA